MSKISAGIFRKLVGGMGNKPENLEKALCRYIIDDKPVVIEGGEQVDIELLEKMWPYDSLPAIYSNGYDIGSSSTWSPWLSRLKLFDLPGTSLMVTPFLAEVMESVNRFLDETGQKCLKYLRDGSLFQIVLPGKSINREKNFVIAVVSDQVSLATIENKMLDSTDYIVVMRKDTKLPDGQILPGELYLRLRELAKLPVVGRGALDRSIHRDKYEMQDWQQPQIKTEQEMVDNPSQFLYDWAVDSEASRFCAILGDYGMGKTFLCRVFTNYMLDEREKNPDLPVPLYLDMRSIPYSDNKELPNIEDMIRLMCRTAGYDDLSHKTVLDAARLGHVILIFDGFDEIAAHLTGGEATGLMREIRMALPARSKGKLILACRTHYFEDHNHEREKVAGGDQTRTRDV